MDRSKNDRNRQGEASFMVLTALLVATAVLVSAATAIAIATKAYANPIVIGATEGGSLATVVTADGKEITQAIENATKIQQVPDLTLPSEEGFNSRFDYLTQLQLSNGNLFKQLDNARPDQVTVPHDDGNNSTMSNGAAVSAATPTPAAQSISEQEYLSMYKEPSSITTQKQTKTGEKLGVSDSISLTIKAGRVSSSQQSTQAQLLSQSVEKHNQAVNTLLQGAAAWYSTHPDSYTTLLAAAEKQQEQQGQQHQSTVQQSTPSDSSLSPSSSPTPTIDSHKSNNYSMPQKGFSLPSDGNNKGKIVKGIIGGTVGGGLLYLNNGSSIIDGKPQNHPIEDTANKAGAKAAELGERFSNATTAIAQSADNAAKAADNLSHSLSTAGKSVVNASNGFADAISTVGDAGAKTIKGTIDTTTWLMNNWYWVIIAAIVIGITYLFLRRRLQRWHERRLYDKMLEEDLKRRRELS